MADPSKFTPSYNFANWQSSNPTRPLPGNQVDAQMEDIATSIDESVEAIKDIRRSDGALQNLIVTPDSLNASTLALMVATGEVRGAWVTATEYAVKNIVERDGATYICAVAHTSGTFETDLAAGKWLLLSAPYQLAGLKWAQSVRAATTANITLSGAQTIDGVSVVADDRVLVKNQSTASQNGIYVAAAGAWARAEDANTWNELVSLSVTVEQGSVNGDFTFVCTVDQGGTLDTTAVTWDTLNVNVNAGAVGTSQLADGALANSTEGRGKMADGFLSADTAGRLKMADGFVTLAKLATGTQGGVIGFGAAGAPVEIATGTSGHVLKGKGAGQTAVFEGGEEVVIVSVSDEITALTTGAPKVTFRMPFAMTVTAVRASLSTAQTSGSILTIDINESNTSILSTKLTVDNAEKTSTTAATAAVISDTGLADDAEITIDIDQVGDGTAKGLKVYLIGRRA